MLVVMSQIVEQGGRAPRIAIARGSARLSSRPRARAKRAA